MIDYTKPAVRLRKTKTIWYKTKRSPTKDGRRVVCPCSLVVSSCATKRSAGPRAGLGTLNLFSTNTSERGEAKTRPSSPLRSSMQSYVRPAGCLLRVLPKPPALFIPSCPSGSLSLPLSLSRPCRVPEARGRTKEARQRRNTQERLWVGRGNKVNSRRCWENMECQDYLYHTVRSKYTVS